MKILPKLLGVLFVTFAVAAGEAKSTPITCAGALPDCLLGEARAAAETFERAVQRDEIQFAIATALGHLGRYDEALDAVATISAPRTQVDALGEIAMTAARMRDFERAYAIAVTIIDGRVLSARIAAFETLAIEQAAAGEIDAAFDSVAAISNPFRRSEAEAAVAISAARAGNIPGAMRAASRIGTNYFFNPNQHQLQIASGVVSRSEGFDHFWFYEALVSIAQIQARQGDILGALHTARSIPDAAGRSRAASRIAAVQADQGDVDGALATAGRVETPYGDIDAMVAMARARAKAADFDGAMEVALELAGAYGHAGGLEAVAVEQARQGLFDESVKTATRIGDFELRTRTFAGIARALVGSKQVADALKVVGMIQSNEDRPALVKDLSVLLAADGQVTRALEIAAEFAGRRNHDSVVVAISLAQAGAGDVDGAITTATGIEDLELRAIALAGIAPLAASDAD